MGKGSEKEILSRPTLLVPSWKCRKISSWGMDRNNKQSDLLSSHKITRLLLTFLLFFVFLFFCSVKDS